MHCSILSVLLLILAVKMEKILDSFGAEDSLYCSHHCVYSDGHLLLFGQKGVQIPTYSSYKYTLLFGSYVVDADLMNKTLSKSVFSSIDKAEDRQEVVFSIRSQVYMLIYVAQEMCDFVEVYLWSSGSWKSIPLKVESKARFGSKKSNSRCSLRYTVVNNDSVAFAFSNERSGLTIFSLLTVDKNGANIAHLFTIDSLQPPFSNVVFFGLYNDQVVSVTGSYGCGFRWHPDRVVCAHLRQGTFDTKELGLSVKPAWAFGGPLTTFQWKNKILLVGGSTALGMTKMKFNGEIWTFDLETFAYEKIDQSLPPEIIDFNVCSSFDQENNVLYVADIKNGIYKLPLENG